MQPVFVYADSLLGYDMGPQHPLKPVRLKLTHDLLDSYGIFEGKLLKQTPQLASREMIEGVHAEEFIQAVSRLESDRETPEARRFGFGTGDNPIFPGIFSASLLYTGASACAAQAVLDGCEIAVNIAGGLHHAHYNRAAGFCIFNDPAVAIQLLRRKYERVAYVDIDVHHGDGVQELFYSDPRVLTVSIHQSGYTLFPGTGFPDEIGEGAGKGFSVNIPMAPETTDQVWIWAWREAALPILKAFDADAVVLQMGADPHLRDPLAQLYLTAQGWLEAVKDVKALGKPIVALGGGGYNMSTAPRMWTLAVAALANVELADATPQAYHRHSDMPFLTDHLDKATERLLREMAEGPPHHAAQRTVAEVKTLLFPVYGLK
ncbi:MAG TPA: acetoin utilization protein AcuC [Chthonomonadales bacterium]|nr:acetoin utilization protein AcuC [Chthonomonadales bacterium]